MQPKQSVAVGNIRAEMARRAIRQATIAKALGVTGAAVSLKLRGERPITLDELHIIASTIGVTTASLLEDPAGARGQGQVSA